MDVCQIYYDNHFRIQVNQTIMLYALNLHSDVCQSILDKTGRKKETKSTGHVPSKNKKLYRSLQIH